MTSSERQPMTAREFFDEYVRKTYEEWQRDPDSRRSMILAIMLNHVADYWQLEKQGQNETGGRKFREDIKKQCPEFGPVWDVAESIKHAKLTRRPDADATAEVFSYLFRRGVGPRRSYQSKERQGENCLHHER